MGTMASGRTALVTGGASGIGAACVARLREDGLRVLVADIDASADIVLDLSDPSGVSGALAAAGDVDVLVNSAGTIGPNKPLWEIEDDEWLRTFALNVHGCFATCRALVPGMRERGWGRIVNIASIAGKEGNPNLAAYSSSKAALIGLTKSLGKELATDGVLVHAIAPAVIDTPMNAATAPEVLEYMKEKIPMGRFGTAEEVAELVAWLASERCTFSTAAVHDISGGRATY